eukprot:jgi/Mesvir1/21032/Mv08080-RA.1
MALVRSGTYLEDYVEAVSSLPSELQRLLNTMRELDERAAALRVQIAGACQECIAMPCQQVGDVAIDEEQGKKLAALREDIERNQKTCLKLAQEKVQLAVQTTDLLDGHIARLDKDLADFQEDLRLEGKGKMLTDVLPGIPDKKLKRDRSTFANGSDPGRPGQEGDIPGSGPRKKVPGLLVDESAPVDPNEPTYCICSRVSFGDMIACDNEDCKVEWFHYECVGVTKAELARTKGKWFCAECAALKRRGLLPAR